jgi:biotin carboxylase
VEGIATTRDFAIEVLRSDAFVSGDYNTSFIDEHGSFA